MEYFSTLCRLNGHQSIIYALAWSPNSPVLASGSRDNTIMLWDIKSQQCSLILSGHTDFVLGVAWSPDGKYLASASADKTIRLWDVAKAKFISDISSHFDYIRSIAWSPDGKYLASASDDKTVQLHEIANNSNNKFTLVFKGTRVLNGHTKRVLGVAWSPDGKYLISASEDRTIRLWNVDNARTNVVFEGHTDAITSVSFSPDKRILASKSIDGTIRFWRFDPVQMIAAFMTPSSDRWTSAIAFHPKLPLLATLDDKDTVISICNIDTAKMLRMMSPSTSVSYTNAKVILVGDSGVGKSGLGLVLSGEKFQPTASTHGRYIWTFYKQNVTLQGGAQEIREILLWDLAGQPGYRLIHQLHLNEVVIALVVFDAHSETDPFAGVYHWNRALCQAQHIQGESALPLKKFLVAARIDCGGVGVSEERIQELTKKLGFDGYFATSAKEGWTVLDLKAAILNGVIWEALPKVSSTELFGRISTFLVAEKKVGRQLLASIDNLYAAYLKLKIDMLDTPDLRGQFETCIGRVESTGLIKQLSFGNLILLQPELLDSYASALINVVKDEPDGLGCIEEAKVRVGDFQMPKDERLKNKEQEKLLLIAMIEDLLRRELVLREDSFLIFPSQSTRQRPDLPDPKGKAVIFDFEGPVLNIYATLSVRLANSYIFKKKTIWKNAITYTSNRGGLCGMFLHNIEEGRGELTLFFDEADSASQETRYNFEEFVRSHLQRSAIPGTIQCRRVVVCQGCGLIMPTQLMEFMKEFMKVSRKNTTPCPNPLCAQPISSIAFYEEHLVSEGKSSTVAMMDSHADMQRDVEATKSVLQGKIETNDFDVFFSYNNKDRDVVRAVGEHLKESGILPWFDEWEVIPGTLWQDELEEQIKHIKTAAIFIGNSGNGNWQKLELQSLMTQFAQRKCRVIPIILPNCESDSEISVFLRGVSHVDFRQQLPNPMERLIWGITGERATL